MRRNTRARSSCARRFSPAGVEPLETRTLLSPGAFVVPHRAAEVDLFAAGLSPNRAHDTRTFGPQAPIVPVGLIETPLRGARQTPPPRSQTHAPTPTPTPAPRPAPAPYSPAQVRHAYGFDQLKLDGSGQTIAIIDAYDDPTIANDLRVFDKRYGLPDPTFIKTVPVTGTPAFDPGWAGEIALDVEWAHAVAPRATILLVEAASSSTTDLFSAVDYAVNHGAKQVSMSWGGSVDGGSAAYDVHFKHPGVTFTASAGDSGLGASYPAASPYVTGVGGTTLTIDTNGNRMSETAWSSGGGGTTQVIPRPGYQAGFVVGGGRGGPDVSYGADPNKGVVVYDTSSGVGWEQAGGTSAGAPQWAGLVALANQGRAALGRPSLGTGLTYGSNQVLYALAGGSTYHNARGDFVDITSGSNGSPASTGYDLATGLGSPVANKLVPDLINA